MGSGSSSLYGSGNTRFAQAKKKGIASKNFSAAKPQKQQKEQKQAAKPNHFAAYPKKINKDKQDRHIPGSKSYTPGRSILTVSLQRAQQLLNRCSGTGTKLNDHKERVNFGEVIGKYVDSSTGKAYDTTYGIIHYSKTGTHIVPSHPKGDQNNV